MKQILRLSLVTLFALVASFSFAQTTVTFTAGTDKGTQSERADKVGDKVSKDGITIETTAGTSAFATAQYRFAKGSTTTFSSTVGNITKIVFTCTVAGTEKYGAGNFTDASAGTYTYNEKVGTWVGDAASFTLTAKNNQVRATKIEVTVGGTVDTSVPPTISGETSFSTSTTVTITAGEGATIYYTTDGQDPDDRAGTQYTAPFSLSETTTVKAIAYYDSKSSVVVSKKFDKSTATEGKGTKKSPYTVSDIVKLNAASQLPSSSTYVTGTVSKVSSSVNTKYGSLTYWLSTPNTTDTLEVYGGLYFDGEKFTSADQIKTGDVATVQGTLQVFNSILEFKSNSKVIKLVRDGKEITYTPEKKDTLSYTVAQASAVLTAGTQTSDVVYVTGTISKIDELSTSFGNATYYISDDGSETGQLQVYRGKSLGNAKFTSESEIKVGDKVKVIGVLTNYTKDGNTTQEIANSYIVELNGVTAIHSVKTVVADDDAPVYNLSGQRVSRSYKGVVIKNGKKVLQ